MAKQGKQATWGGRFNEGPDALMLAFGESISFDWRLAPYDVQVSKAHAAMLCHVGLISAEDRDAIHTGLDEVLADVIDGKLVPDI
ncbi:MAG: argininosuccinate lyase, partial [Verrucomicrobiota bacterium]